MKSRRCARCTHSSRLMGTSSELVCLYILDTGEPRGCPVGKECNKFEGKSQRRKSGITIVGKEKRDGEDSTA